jgi:cell division protein FtsL
MANLSQGRQLNRTYVYGNTVRNMDVKRAIDGRPTGSPLREVKAEAKRARKMNMGFLYVLFLAAAIVVTAYGMISYLKLQADITNLVKDNSRLEQELNNLTLANDDEYSKMINAVDFDEIRRIAIEELDMVYADESQIVTYERETSDYVRQLNNLSN